MTVLNLYEFYLIQLHKCICKVSIIAIFFFHLGKRTEELLQSIVSNKRAAEENEEEEEHQPKKQKAEDTG